MRSAYRLSFQTKTLKRTLFAATMTAAILLVSGCSGGSLPDTSSPAPPEGASPAPPPDTSSPSQVSSSTQADTSESFNSTDDAEDPTDTADPTDDAGKSPDRKSTPDSSAKTSVSTEVILTKSDVTLPENSAAAQQEPPLKLPITFSGTGHKFIGIDPGSPLDSTRWIMEATHDGSGGFQVTAVDSHGKPTDQILYLTGAYEGRSSFAFGRYAPPDAIEITADGNWKLTFTDPRALDSIDTAPGTVFNGRGNEVYRFETDGEPRTIQLACEACEAGISLYSLGQYDWEEEGVLLSEFGRMSGLVRIVSVPKGTEYLEIALPGDPETGRFTPQDWSITVH